MHPNIIFFLIDGLRADQFYGNDRTCKTPNFDSLIQKGMYCEQATSSVDGTFISLNTILASNFQVGNAAKHQKLVLNQNNLIDILKKNGYHIYGVFPNLTSFNSLRQYFENENNSFKWIENEAPPETLPTGLTERITKVLESTEKQEPYFCYFHIFDLHPLREGNKPIEIKKFDSEEFGSSMYARTVSSIDYWFGKILKKINLEKTLLVITADHGERIPFEEKGYSHFQPKFEPTIKLGKKYLPESTHKITGRFFGKVKNTIGKTKLSYSNIKLTPYQKRSRDPYFTLSLCDEMIRVPLLFAGNSIKPKIITEQIRHVDIFPTICELVGIPSLDIKISGRSLASITNENSREENPNYLHTSPYLKPSPLDRIGVRTSKYKYFRAADNASENINLYDLKKDPQENDNIAKYNPQLIKDMEKILSQMIASSPENLQNEKMSEDEEEQIKKELTKLGYM